MPDRCHNNVAATVTIIVAGVIAIAEHTAEADQKDRLTVHRRYVDRTVERYREPWISTKAVERVDDIQILAVRRAHGAIGQGQIKPSPRVVTGVRDREPVAGKRARSRRRQLKDRVDGRYNLSGETKRSKGQDKDY